MVTLTCENVLNITRGLSSDHWIGLRKMLDSTSNSSFSWSHWVNGDPLTFQNWYRSWPLVRSSLRTQCVAMLSFGPWVEKNCSERLPFICYEGKTHSTPLCCCPPQLRPTLTA